MGYGITRITNDLDSAWRSLLLLWVTKYDKDSWACWMWYMQTFCGRKAMERGWSTRWRARFKWSIVFTACPTVVCPQSVTRTTTEPPTGRASSTLDRRCVFEWNVRPWLRQLVKPAQHTLHSTHRQRSRHCRGQRLELVEHDFHLRHLRGYIDNQPLGEEQSRTNCNICRYN